MGMDGKDEDYGLFEKFYSVMGLNHIGEEAQRSLQCIFPKGVVIMIFTNTEMCHSN